MLFNVPQFIDVEDKIVGPLTGKQLLWMLGMGGVLLISWMSFKGAVFFIIAIPASLIFVALAFYRPYNQPLLSFAIHAFYYMIRPKVYVWKRTAEKNYFKKREGIAPIEKEKKTITQEDIQSFARLLDSEGAERDERMNKILEAGMNKKQKKGFKNIF